MTTKVSANLILNPSAMELVTDFSFTNVNTFELLNIFDSTHDLYFITLSVPVTYSGVAGNKWIQWQFGNAPSTWLTSAVYSWINEGNDAYYGYLGQYYSGQTSIALNDSSTFFNLNFWVMNPMSATTKFFIARETGNDDSPSSDYSSWQFGSFLNDTNTYNSLRGIFLNGNIDIKGQVYRLAK